MRKQYDDALGDMLKAIENRENQRRAGEDDAVMVRVDGIGFSKLTSDMAKPYDEDMASCMSYAAARLVSHFNPALAYTQSDEITLIFAPDAQIPYGGRLMKLASSAAAKASSFLLVALMEKKAVEYGDLIRRAPAFDGRAVASSPATAAKFLVWRELDARRNAALGAGRSRFPQPRLHGKTPAQIKRMLRDDGLDFDSLPAHFRHGTILRKREVRMTLSEAELERIPEPHRSRKRGEVFTRSRIVEDSGFPPMYLIENLEEFVFADVAPITTERAFASRVTA